MQGKRLKCVYNTRHSVAATKLVVGRVAYNRLHEWPKRFTDVRL